MTEWPNRQTPATNILIFGRSEIPKYDSPQFHALCEKMDFDPGRTALLDPPSGPKGKGFQQIMPAVPGVISAEGVILLERNTAILVPTRDCLTIVFEDTVFYNTIVVHAGRESLWHQNCLSGCFGCDMTSVIQNAILELQNHNPALEMCDVKVHIINGICAKHFKHDRPGALKKIEHYSLLDRGRVFLDYEHGQLDLVEAAMEIMDRQEILEGQISQEDHCTYGSEGFASKRAHEAEIPNKDGHNLVGVVRVR